MSGKSVHYEVFIRKGAKGAWQLRDALPNRKAATEKAEDLVMAGEGTGAKVVKETLDHATGEYLTLKICEIGDAVDTGRVEIKKDAEIPCFKPQDLYTHHARSVIARLLTEQLGQWKLTAIELMHRADILEQLEAAGTIVQHAIQKAAVAHAQSANEDAQSAVKQLNELINKAFERIYKDNRAGRFPKIRGKKLGPIAEKLVGNGDAEYLLCAAVADNLSSTAEWRDKLSQLLVFMKELPDKGPARDLGLEVIDLFVAEMLEGAAALGDLLGDQENLGDSLTLMADIFLGQVKKDAPVGDGVRVLAREFGKNKLPNSRSAIAQRIIRELKSVRRLMPRCLEEEINLVKTLATKMVMGQGKLLSLDEITEAFTVRSKRLVAHDVIDDYLQDVSSVDDKIEKLIQFEENIVGAENKRTLASFIKPLLTSHKSQVYFIDGDKPVMWRMKRLAELQAKVSKSGLQEHQKNEIVEAFGQLACEIDGKAGLLDMIDKKHTDHAERVLTLLRLVTSDVLPQGELGQKIQLRVNDKMRRPEFRQSLLEGASSRVAELKELLSQAGFDKKPNASKNGKGSEEESAA